MSLAPQFLPYATATVSELLPLVVYFFGLPFLGSFKIQTPLAVLIITPKCS